MVLNRLAAIFVFAAASIGSASANDRATEIVNASVEGFIRPAYAMLAERSGALSDAVSTLCVTPSPATRPQSCRSMSETKT